MFPTNCSHLSLGLTGPAQTTTGGKYGVVRVYQSERSTIEVEIKREKRRIKHLGKYINREHKNKTKEGQKWQPVRRRTIKT